MNDGLSELEQRVEKLDVISDQRPCKGPNADLISFIEIMERITDPGIDQNVVSDIKAADAIQQNCRLLARLEEIVPEIVTGPIRLSSQFWIRTGKPANMPKSKIVLDQSDFVDISEASATTMRKASTKPFWVGLFTSTSVLGNQGMWRQYLDLNRGATLYPLPWSVWAIEAVNSAQVFEISSAAEWVKLVLSYPRREKELLYPDWSSIARKYDAVHMTLRAITAIQGIFFQTHQGIMAPTYWDIESTFWLHWRFDSMKFVEMVR